MKTQYFLFLASLIFASTPSFAEMYKWTDENGKVHFSDKDPANGASAAVEKVDDIEVANTYSSKESLGGDMAEITAKREQEEAAKKQALADKAKSEDEKKGGGSSKPVYDGPQ